MKFAKKALALLLAMLMMIALVACGGDEEDTTSDASSNDDNALVDSDFWDDVSASQNDQQELDNQDTGKTTTTKKDSSKKSTTIKLTTGTKKQTVEVKEFPTIKLCTGKDCDADKHARVRVMTTSDVAAKQYYKDKLKSEYKLTLKEEYVEWGAIPEKLAAAEIAKNSPDAVRYRNDDFPGLMVDNLVQPVDSMVDFSLPLYKELLPYYKTTLWDDKRHLLIDSITMGTGIFYDTKIVKQYAGEDPWELFKAGKWDWNKFAEIAEKIKDDTDGDGAQDLYAFSIGIAPYAFLYSTGTTFGILDNKGKSIKNNIKSEKIARGMNFLLDLGLKKKCGMMNPGTAAQNFYDGKTAMQLVEWEIGDYLTLPTYKDNIKMAKAGRLGIVPMPKDPEADKLYYLCRLIGWWIPKNAKHPEYAVAYNAVRRYFAIDTATVNSQKEACKAAGYTDLHIEQYAANWNYGTPVFEYCDMIGYNTVWRSFMTETAWAQQIAMDTPEIEKKIKECLNLK